MKLNLDFRDLIYEFNVAHVEYILVGAYAMSVHGMPRYTGDIDLFYRPTAENASKVLHALQNFGYTSQQLTIESLLEPDSVFYFGHQPSRIDLLNSISGISFDDAWDSLVTFELDGLKVPVLSLPALAQNKKATGRSKDLVDLVLIQQRLNMQTPPKN